MGNFCRKDQSLMDDSQLHLNKQGRGLSIYDLFKPDRELANKKRMYKSEDPRAKLER
jgi:hypothetical protein